MDRRLKEAADRTMAQPQVCIRLLGGFRAERGGIPIPDTAWTRPQARSLVKLLALQPRHTLHQDQILDALWPDLDPDAALAGLHRALTYARHALEPNRARRSSTYLETGRGQVSLCAGSVWIDVDAFVAGAARARQSGEIRAYEDALEAFTGELLPEDLYEDWATSRREELSALHTRLLLELAGVLQQQGAYGSAIERLEAIVRDDPAHEPSHRQLMRLHASLGHRPRALQQYEVCRKALRDALDLGPEEETERLLRDIQRGRIAGTEPTGRHAGRASPRVAFPATVQRLLRAPLVGRTADTERLRRHLDGTGAATLFLGGQPGIGKSRLLAEIAGIAAAKKMPVLWGGCTRRSEQESFAPLVQALSDYLGSANEEERRGLLHGTGWLARLFPEHFEGIDASLPTGGSSSEGDRRLLFQAFNSVLARIASDGALLLLDDLQWAGQDALDLVRAIAERAPEAGVRVVAAYRTTDLVAGGGLDSLRADLVVNGSADEVDVLPLVPDEACALLNSLLKKPVSSEDARHILEQSGGVPFYLISYAHSVATTGSTRPIPRTAVQSVRQRVARLPPEAQLVVVAASLAGKASPPWLLRQITDLPEATLVDALDAACHAELLEAREAGDYTFVHDLIRDVVEGDISPARRQMLHRRIAAALEALPPTQRTRHAAQLAWHFTHLGERDRAAEYALLAGDAASRALAHAEAVEHYRSAVALSEGRDAARQADALVRVAEAYHLQSQHAAAATALEQAAQLHRQLGDLDGEALAVARLAWMQFFQGTLAELPPRARWLIRTLESQAASRGLCSLYLLLTLLYFESDPATALAAAERATAAARALGDDELLVQAEVRRGLALGGAGRWAEGLSVLEEIVPLAEQIGDLTRITEGLAFAGVGHSRRGDFSHALSVLARALEWAELLGSPGHQAYILGARATPLFYTGRWRECREHLLRAMELERPQSTRAFTYTYALSLAQLSFAEGRDRDADRYLEEAMLLAPEYEREEVAVGSARLRGERALLHGDPAQARSILAPFLHSFIADPGRHLAGASVAAEVLLESGDGATAERILAAAEQAAILGGRQAAGAELLRLRAMALAARQSADADAVFERALATARDLSYPFLEGRILYAWGQASGPGVLARQRVERALEAFDRLGARPYATRARLLLQHMRVA